MFYPFKKNGSEIKAEMNKNIFNLCIYILKIVTVSRIFISARFSEEFLSFLV